MLILVQNFYQLFQYKKDNEIENTQTFLSFKKLNDYYINIYMIYCTDFFYVICNYFSGKNILLKILMTDFFGLLYSLRQSIYDLCNKS